MNRGQKQGLSHCLYGHEYTPENTGYRPGRGTRYCKMCVTLRAREYSKSNPLHVVWWQMMQRCSKPTHHNYPKYGGRGVSVCERWHVYENFAADMSPRPSLHHTLDRIDPNGNYEPSNCRWATRIQQVNNRRITEFVTFRGERRPLSEWADAVGLPYKEVWRRLHEHGWTVDNALTTPLRKVKRRS